MGDAAPIGRLVARSLVIAGVAALLMGVGYAHERQVTSSAGWAPEKPSVDIAALTDPNRGQIFALAFGDSYFTGSESVTATQTFGRLALNGLGYSVAVRGHGGTGYVTASHVDGWPNYVSQVSDPSLTDFPTDPIKVVLLEGGINDALVDADPRLVQLNANWVMRALSDRYPDAIRVVLGVTPDAGGILRGTRLAISRAVRRAAVAAGWRYLDPRSLITPRTVKQIIGPDRLHPTVAGHQEMAMSLQQLLIDAGIPRETTPAR